MCLLNGVILQEYTWINHCINCLIVHVNCNSIIIKLYAEVLHVCLVKLA